MCRFGISGARLFAHRLLCLTGWLWFDGVLGCWRCILLLLHRSDRCISIDPVDSHGFWTCSLSGFGQSACFILSSGLGGGLGFGQSACFNLSSGLGGGLLCCPGGCLGSGLSACFILSSGLCGGLLCCPGGCLGFGLSACFILSSSLCGGLSLGINDALGGLLCIGEKCPGASGGETGNIPGTCQAGSER
ncbi:MAG: hypothetical protein KJ675_13140 [Gammaproteobacteria bacterium]|nr:hypothetical protein [Gammaproteobacteria bacterium]MBU1962121.1 hypothetical protein [Gammaproteobacteria bacterium]